jgi:hypothetical protein
LYLPAHGAQLRGIAIPFRKGAGGEGRHWADLCAIANALQDELGLPAPAVSVASSGGYVLWLSLDAPVPVAEAREFVRLLGSRHPEMSLPLAAIGAPVELPPRFDAATGTWSAFIHPGMGASFADESGLEMEPPAAGQLGFVEGLTSIGADQFRAALATLRQGAAAAPAVPAAPAAAGVSSALLLQDATLEDIVRFLHAKGIEPTFRYVLPPT